jgi:catechol 2,3-dioxygenase-like lactoylglutathione lyase family enzyme
MRWLVLFAASTASMFAQLAAPNEAGVSMGHIHLRVRDAHEQSLAWINVFGARRGTAGPFALLKLPGIFIIVSQGETDGGSDGSAINHIGIAVKDFAAIKAKLKAAAVPMKELKPNQQMLATFPEGVRVEIMEDKDLATPVAFHHLHLSVVDPEAERDWYVKHFGAASTSRLNMPAAAIPGGELDFLKADMPQLPTRNRSLDHMSFEVKNLEAFCKTLQADGVKFDFEYHNLEKYHLKVAFLTDPAGAYIELTEGLAVK